jgi:hypothetical protein
MRKVSLHIAHCALGDLGMFESQERAPSERGPRATRDVPRHTGIYFPFLVRLNVMPTSLPFLLR